MDDYEIAALNPAVKLLFWSCGSRTRPQNSSVGSLNGVEHPPPL